MVKSNISDKIFLSVIGNLLIRNELDKGIGPKTFKLTARVPCLEIDKQEQSIILYEFFDSYNQNLLVETTEVVENYMNVVIHNPRTGFFMSLFNSFPLAMYKISD